MLKLFTAKYKSLIERFASPEVKTQWRLYSGLLFTPYDEGYMEQIKKYNRNLPQIYYQMIIKNTVPEYQYLFC